MGNMLVRRPDLFGAVVCAVRLSLPCRATCRSNALLAEHSLQTAALNPPTTASKSLYLGRHLGLALKPCRGKVPLLDMKRFSHLLAGASWMAEYGNPDTDDWEDFMIQYSAYHNLDPKRKYPPLLMTTSTRDDRVHPYHARAFVKRLQVTHLSPPQPFEVLFRFIDRLLGSS